MADLFVLFDQLSVELVQNGGVVVVDPKRVEMRMRGVGGEVGGTS